MFGVSLSQLSASAAGFEVVLAARHAGLLRVQLVLAKRFGEADGVLGEWEAELSAGQSTRLSLPGSETALCSPLCSVGWRGGGVVAGRADAPGGDIVLRALFLDEDGQPSWTRNFLVHRGRVESSAAETEALAVVGRPSGEPAWPPDAQLHVVARDIWRRDAVGNFALGTAALAAASGAEVRLYAENHHPAMTGLITHPQDLVETVRSQDVVLFHYSTYDPTLQVVLDLPCRKAVYFHNVTPPEFFRPWDSGQATFVERAFAQFPALAGFDAAFANSETSAELLRPYLPARMPIVTVPPVLGGEARWAVPATPLPPELRERRYLLSVGRLAPNKGVLGLLSLFREVARLDASLTLVLAGSPACPAYQLAIEAEVARMSGRVVMAGMVEEGTLRSLYENAAGLISLSAHEGFGLSVLEALRFDLPLFISSDPAMNEVAGDAAIRLPGEDWPALARTLLSALQEESNPEARDRRRARSARLAGRCTGAELLAVLRELADHARTI